MNAKNLAVILVVLLALLFGCALPGNDPALYEKLSALEQKYFVAQNYSSNLTPMNDYINELIQLKSTANGSFGKVIESEIYSAQTFYYLQKALVSSTAIDYQNISCSSTEVKDTRALIKIAKINSDKALKLLATLSDAEKVNLRPNQIDLVKGYTSQIDQIVKFFDEKC